MYMYNWILQQKLTQHYKSTKLQLKKETKKKENQNFCKSTVDGGKRGEEEGEEEKDETLAHSRITSPHRTLTRPDFKGVPLRGS